MQKSFKFDIGDIVVVVGSELEAGNDIGIVAKISAQLGDGDYDYEVDFGREYGFTHDGDNHDKDYYRFYKESCLQLAFDDIFDDITSDEIINLLN